MLIGYLNNGEEVYLDSESANKSIVIIGTPGMGKTVMANTCVSSLQKEKKTAISFKLDGSPIMEGENVNVIDPIGDGIDIRILNEHYKDLDANQQIQYVGGILDALVGSQNLGIRQIGALRNAIIFANENRDETKDDLKAIGDALIKQDTVAADGVYNRLWEVFEANIFRTSKKKIEKGKFNIFDFSDFSLKLQSTFCELVLRSLWMQARKTRDRVEEVVIYIDEFHRLGLNKNAIISSMLCEARQYGISFILVTQTLGRFSNEVRSALELAATHVYFCPADSEVPKIASFLNSKNPEMMIMRLRSLTRGHAIAKGQFTVAGKRLQGPIYLKNRMTTWYGKGEISLRR